MILARIRVDGEGSDSFAGGGGDAGPERRQNGEIAKWRNGTTEIHVRVEKGAT